MDILSEKLNLLQEHILPLSTSASDHPDVFISDSETSESDGELPDNFGLSVPAPPMASTPNGRAHHPRFGGKCSKRQPQPFSSMHQCKMQRRKGITRRENALARGPYWAGGRRSK